MQCRSQFGNRLLNIEKFQYDLPGQAALFPLCAASQAHKHTHTHTQASEQSEITAGGGKSLRRLQKHKITSIHTETERLRGEYKGLWQVQPKTAGLTHLQTSPTIAATAAAAAASLPACHMPHSHSSRSARTAHRIIMAAKCLLLL